MPGSLIRLISLITSFVIFSLIAYSQPSGGGYSESYLLRDVGARAIGMAGTYTTMSGDPMSIFYNPAGLSLMSDQARIATSYSFLEFGRAHSSLAWGQSFMDNFGFGIGVNSFSTGSFTARNVQGNPIGNYSNLQLDIVGGASYKIEFASVGVAFKYLTDNLIGSGTKASGYSFDVGSSFNVVDLFAFGLSIQNISGMMFWNTSSKEKSQIPYTIRTGISTEYSIDGTPSRRHKQIPVDDYEEYEFSTDSARYMTLALDAVITQHQENPTILIGGEIVPDHIIAFRAGIALLGDDGGAFKFLPMTTWGTGVSVRPDFLDLPFNASIDYSVSSDFMAFNKISHNLSIMIGF
jgi:hypothetical protein